METTELYNIKDGDSGRTVADGLKRNFEGLIEDMSGKVDKEKGKGLSSNDYTDEDKQKVEAQDGYVRTIAELRAAIRGLSSVVDNAGHQKVEMLDMADLPLVCGEKMYITGAGAPSVPPTVPFQEYYDGSNDKFYRAKGVLPDTPTVSDWIALN